MEDTIVAISTPNGMGAIAIVRISGEQSIQIVNQIFDGKDLNKQKTHTIHYGYIMDENEKIDEVLVSIMKTPKTFTKEDIVEINCHGGYATTERILELLIQKGCRLAEPGEFTKRAFLNGRIDLLEAESIMDLLSAKTDKMRKQAMKQLTGSISIMIKEMRHKFLEIIANINVNIDYPEYEDIEEVTLKNLFPKIKDLKIEMQKILKVSENGKMQKEGIQTAIIGKPNVGKSSLLNALLEEEKAIVTEIEGTTRDVVEGKIILNGIVLNILDTAGIRKTDNKIEQIGVNKSKKLLEDADLILYVLNYNEKLTPEEKEMLKQIKDKKHVIIINKIDLLQKLDLNEINDKNIVYISTLKNEGIEQLKNQIEQLFHLNDWNLNEMTYLTNAREIALLKQSLQLIEEIEKGIQEHQTIDMLEIDLRQIWIKLGEIIGETYQDELIDQLFSQFCLGK